MRKAATMTVGDVRVGDEHLRAPRAGSRCASCARARRRRRRRGDRSPRATPACRSPRRPPGAAATPSSARCCRRAAMRQRRQHRRGEERPGHDGAPELLQQQRQVEHARARAPPYASGTISPVQPSSAILSVAARAESRPRRASPRARSVGGHSRARNSRADSLQQLLFFSSVRNP